MGLSPAKRIFFNVVATYGRSVFALICGLVTAGWVFQALGKIDYGLLGLIGGMVSFVSFINGSLNFSLVRFYACSVGESRNHPVRGIYNCRKWFSTALVLHCVIPVVLCAVGYPIGEYAIRHWLTIPSNRVEACVLIWIFVNISCFVGMVTVPFSAMYTAKQYIAELTVYSFCTTILNVVFVAYIHFHPNINWLVPLAGWQCAVAVLPQVIISTRALTLFEECRIISRYLFNLKNLRQLLSLALYNSIGSVCGLLRTNGMAILANIYFGPVVNGAMNISNSVISHTQVLTNSMTMSFSPAITSAYGAGNHSSMAKLSSSLNRFGTLAMLIFALPIVLEIRYILLVWLKNPPPYTEGLCFFALAVAFVNNISVGQMNSVIASGRVAYYYLVLGGFAIFTLPLAWLLVSCGGGVFGMQTVLLIMLFVNALGRVYFGKSVVGIPIMPWLKETVIPLLVITFVTLCVGYTPHLVMSASLSRLAVTFIITVFTFAIIVWSVFLHNDERKIINDKFRQIKKKITG